MGVSTDFINTDYVQCKEMLENVSSSNPIATSYGKFYSFSQIYPFFNGARSAPQNTTVSDISVPVNGRRMRPSEDLARCTGCLETISDQFYCCVGEQIWHQACLRCCICGKLFSERCYTREGQLYCREDFMRHYGPKCTGCHKTIQATDLVQFAKSSIFHAKCFRCTICERQFTQGDQCCFARGNQLLICHEHYVATVQPHLNGIQSNSPPMTGVDQGQSRLNMDLTIPVETSVGGRPAISSSSSSPVGSFSSMDAHSTQGQSIANTTLTTLNVRHSLYKPDLPQTRSPNMPVDFLVTDSQESCEAHHEMKSTNRMHELLPSKVWTTSIKNDTVHNDECMFVTKDAPWPQRTNFDGLTSSIKNQASWNLNSQTEYTQLLDQEAQDNVRAVRKSSTDAGEMQHSLLNVVTEYNESHQKDDPAEDVLDNSPDPLVYLLQHQESQQSLAPDCSYDSQASPIYSTSGGLHLSEASSPQPSEVSENGTGPSVGDAPVTSSTVTGAGGGGAKRRGPRTTIKAKQLETLKAAFAATPKPTRHVRESLAQETGLSMRVIQVWFQNRRSKERRMKQLNALGPRRGFYRNPRRLRGIRPGILHSELNNDTAVELMNNPVYQGYLLENNPELYNVLAATAAAASFNSNQCTVGPPLFNYPSSSEPILAGEMRAPTMNLPGAPTFDIPYPPFNPSFSPVTLTNNRINDAKNDIRYATPTYIPGVQTACRLPFTRLPSPASSTPPAPMFNDSFNLFPPQSLTTNHSQAPAGSLFTRSSLCSSAALP